MHWMLDTPPLSIFRTFFPALFRKQRAKNRKRPYRLGRPGRGGTPRICELLFCSLYDIVNKIIVHYIFYIFQNIGKQGLPFKGKQGLTLRENRGPY